MHGVEDRVPFIFGGEASGDGKIPCLIWVGVTCGFYLIECPSGEPWWQETHFSLRYISIRRNAYHKEKTQLFVQTKPLQRRCNAWEDPVSTQIKSYMRWCSMSLTRHIQSYMKMHCNPPKGTEEPWTCAAHHLWHNREQTYLTINRFTSEVLQVWFQTTTIKQILIKWVTWIYCFPSVYKLLLQYIVVY